GRARNPRPRPGRRRERSPNEHHRAHPMSEHEGTPAPDHPSGLLAGLVDGTLTAAERAEVDAHLATCSSCREEVGLAAAARRALRDLPEVEAPLGVGRAADLEARRSAGRVQGGGWRRRAGAAMAVAAAVALVAGLAVVVLRGGHQGAGPAAAPAGVGSTAD